MLGVLDLFPPSRRELTFLVAAPGNVVNGVVLSLNEMGVARPHVTVCYEHVPSTHRRSASHRECLSSRSGLVRIGGRDLGMCQF